MYRIKPYDGIHPVQRPVFPVLYFRKDTVRYAAYGLCRYAVAELFLQDVAYFPCAVADGVQAYDTVRKGVRKDLLAFAHNLGIKSAVAVPGVFMVISPIDVCTCLLMCPLLRLPNSRSPPSR